MTSIYQTEYPTREAALQALQAMIVTRQDEQGATRYAVQEENLPNLQSLRAQRRAALQERDAEIAKRMELQKKLDALIEAQRQSEERLDKLSLEPSQEKVRDALKRYAQQEANARARIADLEAQIKPLREQNDAYKARETTREIERQLVDAAQKLNCCPSALRDVKRLAPLFKLNDAGVAVNDQNQLAYEAVQEEIALSPHWLNRSQGANASSGGHDAYTAQERYQEALRGGDFYAVIQNAPRLAPDQAF
ncbi:MAG: hypothetical protein Q4G03_10830 [Planctomycetia bacterium]|nr:hypothetical protein [Planctomycetia bacterium]